MKYDWLIVGAGFTGATIARLLAEEAGQKVLVVDRRDHIAGNAHDRAIDGGGYWHSYGPHIFHTNSVKVWRFLSRFTEWAPYFHRVQAHIDGNFVPLPFNINSINALFPHSVASKYIDTLIEHYGYGRRIPILDLKSSDSSMLKDFGDYVQRKVFDNYTKKQWSLSPEQLDASVTARVPVSISRDDRYFTDEYQAMPLAGYTALFDRMLSHPGISVSLSTRYSPEIAAVADRVVYTGPIDEYFDYQFGPLPYRSVRFVQAHAPLPLPGQAATVNFPNEFEFTRYTSMPRLTAFDFERQDSVILEYPEAHIVGSNEPYYPIPSPNSHMLLQPYLDHARTLAGKVWFAGRLGDYAYYNMDQACARAMALFEKQLAPVLER